VPAGVLLAPILPGITDSEATLAPVMAAAAEHGATSLGSAPLRLAPDVKEHYFGFIGEVYPDLLPRYQRAYPVTNAPREYQERLQARVDRLRSKYGFAEDSMRKRDLMPGPANATSGEAANRNVQLALPL
jgi:DNA repair photolyase